MATEKDIVAIVIGAFALMMALLAYVKPERRTPLTLGAICAAIAAASAYYDAFWSMACLGTLALSGLLIGSNLIDASWRMRASLVMGTTLLAGLSLWPTLHKMSNGRLPIPAYVADNVDFEIVPGLDLRGGMRLVYTVDVHEAIRDRRDRHYENMRLELAKLFDLHEGDQRPTDEVYVKLRELVHLEAPRRVANTVILELKPGTDPAKVDSRFLNQFSAEMAFSRSDDQRRFEFRIKEDFESQLRETAVAQAKEIILRRIDSLGLREASVSTRDEDIIVEFPDGEEDQKMFNEVREIISQTARLEFKLLDDDNDYFGAMSRDTSLELPDGIEFRAETVSIGADKDGNAITKTAHYVFIAKGTDELIRDTLERFKLWTSELELPLDRELGYEIEYSIDPDTARQLEAGWRTYLLKSRAEITGDLIRDAQAVPDQGRTATGGWYVALEFTDTGGAIFERITGENIKRRFAIILDDRVESAPVIQSRIPGGHASITMGSSDPQTQLRDSRKLELVLRSGALPAPITPSNEQMIGPTLGAASIALGVRGALIGAFAVLCCMVLYYQRSGLIANITVLLNLLLQLAVLATFNASMTLPGIAGLTLTLAMSVDANVLINERIREEIRDGRSPRVAVDQGYSMALSSIMDGQLTTLICAMVLAHFGTGPIKGFAITLMVGVITSIFTGVVASRLFFDVWVRRMSREAKLDVG